VLPKHAETASQEEMVFKVGYVILYSRHINRKSDSE
jgi:hypothetical protein